MGRVIQGSFNGLGSFLDRQVSLVKAAARRASVEAAELGVTMATVETDKKGSVDRGNFKLAWESRPMIFGAQIRNGAPYAAFIERGTRPHWPPLAPILAWVMRKNQMDEEDAYPIARAVQVKIARSGTKPRFIMKDILPKIKRVWENEVEREIEAIS